MATRPQLHSSSKQPAAAAPAAVPQRSVHSAWWRLVGAGAVALLLGLGGLALLWLLARPLALLVLSVALAEALEPAVQRLGRWLPRGAAILLLYASVLLVLVGIGWVVIPAVAGQLEQASQRLPELLDSLQRWTRDMGPLSLPALSEQLPSQLGNISSSLLALPLTVFSSLLEILLVFVVSVYWLFEAPAMLSFSLSLVARQQRQRARDLFRAMGQAMGGYVRGIIIDGLIIGVLVYFGLLLIGVRYALVLALLAAMLELIPFIGPVIAGGIMVAVALADSPTSALLVLGFVIALQQLENNLLVPNIMRSQTDVSPLLVIVAVFAGSSIGGVLGALVAVPLSAALRVLACQVLAPAIRRRTGAAEAPAPPT